MSARPARRRAWAYLSRVVETPSPAVHEFITLHGVEEAERRIRARSVPRTLLAATQARAHLELAEDDLSRMRAVGGRLVTPDDEEWPAWQLLAFGASRSPEQQAVGKTPVAPVALWVRGRGDLLQLTERAVAVVGTRDISGYGERVTNEFCHDLVAEGFTVISGGAFGIDGAAHRAVLSARGSTVAVLACGADRSYPAGHTALLGRIMESGLVVSEYPPGTSAARYRSSPATGWWRGWRRPRSWWRPGGAAGRAARSGGPAPWAVRPWRCPGPSPRRGPWGVTG